jgi:hypothetical protein
MYTLPTDKAAAQMFTASLRRATKLTAVKPIAAELITGGVFVDAQNKVIGGVLADLSLVCLAGAAFSLIPADAARDSIKAKGIEDFVRENFSELLNIFSGLFTADRSQRVRLSATRFPADAANSDLAALVANPAKRMDVEVDIEGYGRGRMSLLLAA